MLLHTQPWELEHSPGESRLTQLIGGLVRDEGLSDLLTMLEAEELPSAWFAGQAIARAGKELGAETRVRFDSIAELNASFLAGYLDEHVNLGDPEAFDSWLDSATDLPRDIVLLLTIRGPASQRARDRVRRVLPELTVVQGTRLTLGWYHKVGPEDLALCLAEWMPRISSQGDYEALVDWIGLPAHNAEIPGELREQIWEILQLRTTYPELGNARFLWNQLAGQYVTDRAAMLAALVVGLIEQGLMVLGQDYESDLLRAVAAVAPGALWSEVAERLEKQSWRLAMHLRGWFTDAIPEDIITQWVGDSAQRAKVVASIATAGAESPTPLARFLLDRFGDVEEVGGSLAAEYVSGGWSGPASGRYGALASHMDGWMRNSQEPPGVKRWAERMKQDLVKSRDEALLREAEGRF